MNAHHVESFVADSGEAVRRCWRDYDDVAGADNDLFPVDDHGRLTGEHNASLGVGMLMQARAFAGREVTQKEGNTGARSARLRTQLWRLRLFADHRTSGCETFVLLVSAGCYSRAVWHYTWGSGGIGVRP